MPEVSLLDAATKAMRVFQINSGELEEENDRLVWSFDIMMAHSADIVEVQVDALSGKVISVEMESAKPEAVAKFVMR